LEKKIKRKNFWQDKEKAIKIIKLAEELKEEIEKYKELEKDLADLKVLADLADQDKSIAGEIIKNYNLLKEKIKLTNLRIFLSDPYDKGSAILEIFAGAGGQDAQDWARMLLRMYERYCQKKGWKVKIISQSFGQGVWEKEPGIKEATLEVKGKWAFGLLKKEAGVHRLVRISPFSPKKLRHTSFAKIEVLPLDLKKEDIEIRIDPKDLKIETFRASGPGGQYVNRRESAVRITHLPTKIVVSSQGERLQGLNRKKAIKILYAKLYQLRLKEKKEKAKEFGINKISPSWGNQIRSYVLDPYKLVKDLRTGVETSNIEKVFDGELDQFIEAQIYLTQN
jgi:peptide chain release factor 2